ncbi:MAG: hypothetical protein JXA33_01725 [Anaerolineae bacterium]|nr:hypothetical protein [Anaerolineae bacterium]
MGIGQRQGNRVARHLYFEHGDKAHVAIRAGRVGGDLGGRHRAGESAVIVLLPLHLPGLIAARPIEDVEGIRQMGRYDRAQLEIHHHRLARLQAVNDEFEGVFAGKRLGGGKVGEGRSVHAVGDAVVVVIAVEEVGRAVVVRVLAHHVRGKDGCRITHALRALDAVRDPVVVGVRRQRVAEPLLTVVGEGFDLNVIRDAIPIRVRLIHLRAEKGLLCIGERVAILVAGGRFVSSRCL